MSAETNETNVKMLPVSKVGSEQSSAKSPSRTHGCPSTSPGSVPIKWLHLPLLFDRSSGAWWNPRFDSDILENKLVLSYFRQTRLRFQFALIFTILGTIAWCIYYGIAQSGSTVIYIAAAGGLAFSCVLLLISTFTTIYARFYMQLSIVYIVILIGAMLGVQFVNEARVAAAVGSYALYMGILLLLYTIVCLPLYVAIILGLIYTIIFDVMLVVLDMTGEMGKANMIVSRIILHIAIHVVGIHVSFMSQVQRHSTFVRIGQAAIARRGLQIEKQIREKMIHSLMPPSVAKEVMQAKEDKDKSDDDDENYGMRPKKKKRGSDGDNKGEMVFRSFQMNQMVDVSILFADIVGFTKMSSNKTAEHLVGLLNDLFGRFDRLCTETGCEKISTLGDCYYCVSGCPEPRPDHAKCCVEMGLGMIKAIQQFDEDNNESVNMRVGVHTGTVLCGIVGTRRFKFDVWSNDVTLANIMESSGEPGRVHISEKSYNFLKDEYHVEQGEDCVDNSTYKVLIEHYDIETSMFAVRHTEEQKTIKTYFITGHKRPGIVLDPVEEMTADTSTPKAECSDQTALMIKEPCPVVKEDVEAGGVNHVDKPALKPTDIRSHQPWMTDAIREARKRQRKAEKRWRKSQTTEDKQIYDEARQSAADKKRLAIQQYYSTHKHHGQRKLTLHEDTEANGVSTAALFNRRHSQGFYGSEMSVDKLGEGSKVKHTQSHETSDHSEKTGPGIPNEEWDLQLVNYIDEDVEDESYFYSAPLHRCLIMFHSKKEEDYFRRSYHKDMKTITVTSPRFHALIEIVMSFVVFFLVSVCCFIAFQRSIEFIVIFILCLIVEILLLVHVITDVKIPIKKSQKCTSMMMLFDGWISRNILGAVLACIPAIVVYTNFSCAFLSVVKLEDRIFCMALLVSLLNFCNFTTLSSWMKIFFVIVISVTLLITLQIDVCHVHLNVTDTHHHSYVVARNITALFTDDHPMHAENIINTILFLMLVIYLNHALEISHRVGYHGHYQADKDRKRVQENRDQADWLLHNIIPKHVSEVVKRTSKYSKNHSYVGVIFATIVNFNDFYDESYAGGREYLRVLNELISDYEDLLDKPEFKDVEKIKTISSSFMAASGINELSRSQNKHQFAHLFGLLDFCTALLRVNDHFNEGIFNFDFVMNIGFNFGDVTAGVIGTTKLHYDIWGDTVNISSRMYSTGVANRVQVPEASYLLLGDMFEFEYRGLIFVKGKGDMKTYLLKTKRPGAQWD